MSENTVVPKIKITCNKPEVNRLVQLFILVYQSDKLVLSVVSESSNSVPTWKSKPNLSDKFATTSLKEKVDW